MFEYEMQAVRATTNDRNDDLCRCRESMAPPLELIYWNRFMCTGKRIISLPDCRQSMGRWSSRSMSETQRNKKKVGLINCRSLNCFTGGKYAKTRKKAKPILPHRKTTNTNTRKKLTRSGLNRHRKWIQSTGKQKKTMESKMAKYSNYCIHL